jgi:hypothetical protein
MPLLACATLAQQDPAQAQPAPPASVQKPQGTPGEAPMEAQKEGQNGTQNGTSKDRLFYTLPNFLTLENAGQLPPLTVRQKFKVVAQGSFDYVEFFWYGALAGVSQADDSEPGYGQGARGYGKRYGSAFGDGTIENFWTQAILPSVLRQDPRFYQNGKGSFLHRTGSAVERMVVIRSDAGKSQFNASEIVGSGIAAVISTYSYHPSGDRNLSNTASVWGTQMSIDTVTLIMKEFWPDVRRKLSRKKLPESH